MKKWLGALTLVFVLVLPASAQEAGRRGLWGGFGVGGGSIGCADCETRESGFSGFGVIGGTLSDVVRIGGGSSFFVRETDAGTLNLGSALFLVQVFPGRGQFFLQAGSGFSTAELEFADVTLEDQGAAFLLGLGYNIRLSSTGSLSLTPYANWTATTISFEPEFWQIGVALFAN